MQVILEQDLKGKGKKGDLVSVKEGYARNFLLTRCIAIEATKANFNVMEYRKRYCRTIKITA